MSARPKTNPGTKTKLKKNNITTQKKNSQSSLSKDTAETDQLSLLSASDFYLSDIVGQDAAIKELNEYVEVIKQAPIYEVWNISPAKGILLIGPPGCGKTESVRALVNELGSSVAIYQIRYVELASKWLDETIERLRALFKGVEEAAKNKHVIVFIDEIDSMVPNRSNSIHESTTKRVTVFLEWLDGGLKQNRNITLIGTSNFKDGIDPALLRTGRMDKIITYQKLSVESIIKGLQIHLKKRNIPQDYIGQIDWTSIEPNINPSSYTGSDLKEIVTRVMALKARLHVGLYKEKSLNPGDFSPEEILKSSVQPDPISAQDFIHVIKDFENTRGNDISKQMEGF